MDFPANRLIQKNFFPRRFFSLVLASLVFLSSNPTALGQERKTKPTTNAVPDEEKILEGIDYLYNLQFTAAENLFQKIITEYPEKPVGYFYHAMVTWSRMVAGFWSKDNVAEYRQRIARTVDVARYNIKNDPSDSYNYFYLGGALGFLARFELMRGKWFSSFLHARKAVKALKKCLKMDPENRDVLLGLGIFDYYTARFSGAVKFLSYLLLHKGNKEKGLKKLHIAAGEAVFSRTEAKSSLLYIYLFLEKDYLKALNLAEELGEKYDQDPSYSYYQGVCFIKLEKNKRYENTTSYMRQRSHCPPLTKTSFLWERRLRYLESTYDLFHGNYPEARKKLTMILSRSDAKKDPLMIALPLLKIGMSYDFEGNKQKAAEYYRRIIKLKNPAGVQFLAKKFLENAPSKDDPLIGY